MTNYKADIHITLKNGVLDPQGKASLIALDQLGFQGVHDVRQGKYIELWLDASDEKAAQEQAEAMCEKLLANTVIESYSVSIIEAKQAPEAA